GRAVGERAADAVRGRGGRPSHAGHDLGRPGGGAVRLHPGGGRDGGGGAGCRDRGLDGRDCPHDGGAAVQRAQPPGGPARRVRRRVRFPARPAARAGRVRQQFVVRAGAAVLRRIRAGPGGRVPRPRDPEAYSRGRLRARAEPESGDSFQGISGMSLVNFTAREISCKIVYYGPGRSGKTTNLQYIYSRVPEERRGSMVSLATQTDRTLFFDFLPIELGTISGFTTRFQLYTVPGQVYYNATRKLVLQGTDGIVFVADSQVRQLDENIESLQNLQANVLEQGLDVRGL